MRILSYCASQFGQVRDELRIGASLRIAEAASVASVTKGAARDPDTHRRKSRPATHWLTAFLANEPDMKIVAGLDRLELRCPDCVHEVP